MDRRRYTDGGTDADGVIADATPGDVLRLSRYVDEVRVHVKPVTKHGPALIVRSTHPQATSRYRLRAVDDDDDRLLLEKDGDDGWDPHVRVDANAPE